MEKDFDVKKNGSALVIELVNELSADNAPLLIEEMSKYANQDIQRVVFNATGLIYISSSGLRTVFYAYQDLGDEPEIVFVRNVSKLMPAPYEPRDCLVCVSSGSDETV